jgi:hypothetical protein
MTSFFGKWVPSCLPQIQTLPKCRAVTIGLSRCVVLCNSGSARLIGRFVG